MSSVSVPTQVLTILRSRKSTYYFYAFNALCLVWAVVSIEVILIWNHIQGVYTIRTTGQLIPFVIGVTSLLSLMQKISVGRASLARTEILMVSRRLICKWHALLNVALRL